MSENRGHEDLVAAQISAQHEAIVTLKQNHRDVMEALSDMRDKQAQQTIIISSIQQTLAAHETLQASQNHEVRISELEHSHTKVMTVSAFIAFIITIAASFFQGALSPHN